MTKPTKTADELAALVIAEYRERFPTDLRPLKLTPNRESGPSANWSAAPMFWTGDPTPEGWLYHWIAALSTVQSQYDLSA